MNKWVKVKNLKDKLNHYSKARYCRETKRENLYRKSNGTLFYNITSTSELVSPFKELYELYLKVSKHYQNDSQLASAILASSYPQLIKGTKTYKNKHTTIYVYFKDLKLVRVQSALKYIKYLEKLSKDLK